MAAVLKYFTAAAAPFHKGERWINKRNERPEGMARLSYSSRVLYLGNLAFVTTDAQVYALFSRCGPIEKVVMGLNSKSKEPCGFAFVIYRNRESAIDAVETLNGTVLDERVIKVEMDKSFHEGKQFGKAESGGQLRDELRADFDAGRGGEGRGLFAKALSREGEFSIDRRPSQSVSNGFGNGQRGGRYGAGASEGGRYDNRGGYEGRGRGRSGHGPSSGGGGGGQPAAAFGGPAGTRFGNREQEQQRPGQKRHRDDDDGARHEAEPSDVRAEDADDDNYRRVRRRDKEGEGEGEEMERDEMGDKGAM